MSDVLLVQAPLKNPRISKQYWSNPPLILGYIASVLMKEDYQVSAVDFNDDKLKVTPERPFIDNPDELPFPLRRFIIRRGFTPPLATAHQMTLRN